MATDFPPADPTTVDAASTLLPSGRFLLTTTLEGFSDAHIISNVSRISTTPPLLLVGMEKGLSLSPMIRDSRRFAIGVLPQEPCALSRMFGTPATGASDRFLGLPCLTLHGGLRMPSRVRGWFACEMVRHLDVGGDREVYIGLVYAASLVEAPSAVTPARASSRLASPRGTSAAARSALSARASSRLRSRA